MKTMRFDRATLQPAIKKSDGSYVRECVLARAGVRLDYSWGSEVATEAALSDRAYLDSLAGLPLVAGHPDVLFVDISRPDTYDEVGVVLSARWDAKEKAVVATVSVRNEAANKAIESGQTGVSEGYHVTSLDTSVVPHRQLKRLTNHVAMTLHKAPRMEGAHFRSDEKEGHMLTKEKIVALLAKQGIRADSEDSILGDLAALKGDPGALEAALARIDTADKTIEKLQAIADSIGVTEASAVDKAVSARVDSVVKLRLRADELGVEIPDSLSGLDEIRAHVAEQIQGSNTRCDSADYCDGVIASAQIKSANDAAANAATFRNDSTNIHRF